MPVSPVLVLGAGINGAAVARQLVLNKVPVWLVDRGDLAAGATAYSSRLIHGGVRYLEHRELDLVRESLAERTRLLMLAPQFVKPLRLYIPVESQFRGLVQAASHFLKIKLPGKPKPRGLWLVRTGLWMYDRYAQDPHLPRYAVHRASSAEVPPVDAQTFRWLCSYSDAQVRYPERLVLAMLDDARHFAERHGVDFQVHTYSHARREGQQVHLHRSTPWADSATPSGVLRPSVILNATGAWIDHTLERLKVPAPRLIGGTKGSHLVTWHADLRRLLDGRGIYVEAADARPVFLLPLGDATLIGTTDLPFEGDPAEAVATEAEIEYLLAVVNRVFPQLRLSRGDIEMHYSGVRPLPYVGDGRLPASVTRRHVLHQHAESDPPMYSLVGGKLTTCRSFAEETAAQVLELLRLPLECDGRDRTLPGGHGFPRDASAQAQQQRQLAERLQLSTAQVDAVWQLCGTKAGELLEPLEAADSTKADGIATAGAGPSSSRSTPANAAATNLPGTELPERFVRRVLREQWVQRLEDLVERRLMLLYHRELTEACLRRLAELMADEGILPRQAIEEEVGSCRERLERHYGKRLA